MFSITFPQLYVFYKHHPGTDLGFLTRGFKFTKGVRLCDLNICFIKVALQIDASSESGPQAWSSNMQVRPHVSSEARSSQD